MIIGIDEVGRGCWAGPLVAAAVGFADNQSIAGLADSKKLSVKKRLQLVREIQGATEHIGVGWVWPREINQLGLTASVRLAMERAFSEIKASKTEIIIDGSINYLPSVPKTRALVRADGSIPAVSAASVIAKVARDTYMIEIAEKYPDYGFEKHVGYGTRLHIEALKLHGVLPIHRINYKPIQQLLASGL